MTWTPPAFTPGVVWQDLPSTASALDAQNLNLEENSEAAYAALVAQSVVDYFETGDSAAALSYPVQYVDAFLATAANVPAAVQSAINAATNGGTTEGKVVFTPGHTYAYAAGTTPTIPSGLPGRGLIIDWTGATIQLSTTVPRAFDLATGSAGRTFRFGMQGGTVDANWAGGLHHIVCGTYQGGGTSSGTDINLGVVAHRGIKVVNALTDANTTVNHRRAFLYYLTASSTNPTVGRVLWEDCDVEGGNSGFEVLGASSSVAMDTVLRIRCRHRMRAPVASATLNGGYTLSGTPQTITLNSTAAAFNAAGGTALYGTGAIVTPVQITYTGTSGSTLLGCTGSGSLTSGATVAQWGQNATFGPQTIWFASANWQTGSHATVRHVSALDCQGYYSGDVGEEVDNSDFAMRDGCVLEDAFNTNSYYTNFDAPLHPDEQVVIYRNDTSRRVLVANTQQGGCGRCDTHSGINLGSIEFQGRCVWTNVSGNITTADGLYVNGPVRSVDLDGLRVVIESFTHSSGTLGHTGVTLGPSTPTTGASVLRLGRFECKCSGIQSGGTYTFDGVLLIGNTGLLHSISPSFDIAVSGAASGSLRCVEVNGSGSSPTVQGVIRGLKIINMTGDGGPRGVMIRGTANVTIPNLLITECDFSGMSVAGGEVFFVDTTNKGTVRAHNNIYLTRPANSTWTVANAVATIQQFGWDAIVIFAAATGSGITRIDVGIDGSSFDAILQQSSGALPAGYNVPVVVPAGAYLKVTYSTTQPNIFIVPYNP